MLDKIKQYSRYLLDVVIGILVLFFEQKRIESLKTKLGVSDTKDKQDVLQQHTTDVQSNIDKDRQQATQQEQTPETNDELLNWLNKKK